MKIGVTYENGQIFQHFGHTEQFRVYEVQDGKVVSSTVVDTNGSGHGALAGFLKEQQVDTLICGGIGAGAQNALAAAGIRLYGGVSGDADAAVEALLKGELDYNPNVQCNHHGEHHRVVPLIDLVNIFLRNDGIIHAHGYYFDAPKLCPLLTKRLLHISGKLIQMQRNLIGKNPLGRDLCKGHRKLGQQLALHDTQKLCLAVLFLHVPADVCIEQNGINNLKGILSVAFDAGLYLKSGIF